MLIITDTLKDIVLIHKIITYQLISLQKKNKKQKSVDKDEPIHTLALKTKQLFKDIAINNELQFFETSNWIIHPLWLENIESDT